MTPNFKTKPIRSEKYLKWIKTLPCCVCDAPSDHAHHIISIGLGGIMGDKIDDVFSVPMCGVHHYELHQQPKLFDQVFYLLKTLLTAFRSGVLKVNL